MYAATTPALVRCGWGLERNRNGGSAAAAVLALPAVGGKFGVRGGGYSMSNSSAWGIKAATWLDETPEPATRLVNMNHLGRALTEYDSPPVQMLFVYNCNPLATMPDQSRVLEGLQRDDLFTVVYEQVVTDTARYADVLLPATTFVENYDVAKGYGPISLQLVRPVIEPVGEARPNAEVFSEIARAARASARAEEETDTLLRIVGKLPPQIAGELMEHGSRDAAPRRRAGPIRRRVSADAGPQGAPLLGGPRPRSTGRACTAISRIRRREQFPLALISPASEKSVSSTLAELRQRAAVLQMNPADAAGARARDRRSGAGVQRARRSPLPGRAEQGHPPGHRLARQGPLAEEHLQRIHVQRAGPRFADRPRRRRLLQRRAGASRVAGKTLNVPRADVQTANVGVHCT